MALWRRLAQSHRPPEEAPALFFLSRFATVPAERNFPFTFCIGGACHRKNSPALCLSCSVHADAIDYRLLRDAFSSI